jgi:hypothetical protein
MNTMGHLAQCLSLNTPKAQQTRQLELNPAWLHDLHEGVYNEYQYMQKMSVNAVRGGLWRDFTAIKWIADYLQKPIYVWSTASGHIIAKEECEFELEPLHIAFGSSHFEPIEKLTPKRLRVFLLKTASKQPLLKASWIVQNWNPILALPTVRFCS